MPQGASATRPYNACMGDDEPRDYRSERRERRRRARMEAMRKHGATLGEVYRNAVLKRAGKGPNKTRRKKR